MKTEQEMRDMLARVDAFHDRISSFADKMREDGERAMLVHPLRMIQVDDALSTLGKVAVALHWCLETHENLPPAEIQSHVEAGYTTLDGYVGSCEELVNLLYGDAREMRSYLAGNAHPSMKGSRDL